ncbi:lipoprotein [Salmonella enterica subsp. enterica]|uniref:Lipoprotein n=1 Tax=Salmonella enterica I TaxID=59201 RepID=A0A379WNP0_SALET|nr:lipoprotein [Salmonella enterica subsp. enterica]
MKHLRVVACMIMLALAGCDNNDKTAPTTKSEAPAVAQPSPAQDPAQLQKLAQQSQGKALTLLDALRSAARRRGDAGADVFNSFRS